MKLFGLFHMFCPLHNAGSEVTVYVALAEMVRRGHEVMVVADRTPNSYEIDGIKVLAPPRGRYVHDWVIEQAKGSDVLITHLDCTSPAMQLSLDLRLPLVHFVHNHMQLGFHSVSPHKAHLVIFNSEWVAKRQEYQDKPWPGRSIVMHPIVEPDRYRCERGTKITFCNPTDGKGVATVHKLAEAMPGHEFLIVEGIYGEQVAPPNLGEEWERAHPNIEHMKNSPDFRDVLRKTKVLLMPSNYESYGRCAVEAACAGIPSIVHPTEGLLEALEAEREPIADDLNGGWVSGAGIFCDRSDISSWKAQIERLFTDEIYYRSRSDTALELASKLDPQMEFDRLENALLVTSEGWQRRENDMQERMWTSDRRLYKARNGRIKDFMEDGDSLYVGEGGRIPEAEAIQLGLYVPPAVTVTPQLDTKALLEPEEDKAIHAPEENKSKRKRKVA